MNLIYRLFGYTSVSCQNSRELVNLFLKYGLNYRIHVSETCAQADIPVGVAKRLEAVCGDVGFDFNVKPGILPAPKRLLRKYGLIAGVLVSLALMILSSLFVWDVRIDGNSSVPSGEIIRALSDCGVGVGAYIPDIDADRAENSVLLRSGRLSWIGINLKGTVIYVTVRESRDPEKAERSPANVVASRNGIIEYICLENGEITVAKGDAVTQGQVLISGISEDKELGLRISRAKGVVMARTAEEIFVRIPLEYTAKCYFDTVKNDKYVNFFGKIINLSKNSGNSAGNCDIIYKEYNICLPNGRELPVSVCTNTYREFTLGNVTRSAENAKTLAYLELEQRINRAVGDGQLLNRKIYETVTEDCVLLTCRITYIGNIAETREFEVTTDEYTPQ